MNGAPAGNIDPKALSEFLFGSPHALIFLVDGDFRVLRANKAFSEAFAIGAWPPSDARLGNAIGCRNAVEENVPCGDTTACETCELRVALAAAFDGTGGIPAETTFSRRFYLNGIPTRKRFLLTARPIASGSDRLAAAVMNDITEGDSDEAGNPRKDGNGISGVHDLKALREIGEVLFQNAIRGNLSLSVAVIGIDGIDEIGETFGHATRDAIVAEVAAILKGNTRKSDVLASFGGGDFALIMHGHRPRAIVDTVAKLRELAGRGHFGSGGEPLRVTLSAGIASRLEATLDATLRRADDALYRARSLGPNRQEPDGGPLSKTPAPPNSREG